MPTRFAAVSAMFAVCCGALQPNRFPALTEYALLVFASALSLSQRGVTRHMASSCKDQRQALLECLADSPCIIAGKPIGDCVKLSTDESGCKEFNTAFFLCKRGQVCAEMKPEIYPTSSSLFPCHFMCSRKHPFCFSRFTARYAQTNQGQYRRRYGGRAHSRVSSPRQSGDKLRGI